jgi:hypothetical protein
MADKENDPLNPKSKKAPKKKVIEELTRIAAESTPTLPAVEQKALEDMVRLAQLEYLKSVKSKVIKEKRREISALDDQIKEFMGPYILIGYDLNSQPVEIISAQNPAENDALLERFRRVMFKINQNIVNSNGEDPYGNQPD